MLQYIAKVVQFSHVICNIKPITKLMYLCWALFGGFIDSLFVLKIGNRHQREQFMNMCFSNTMYVTGKQWNPLSPKNYMARI